LTDPREEHSCFGREIRTMAHSRRAYLLMNTIT
jgi:hypothetical protein